MRRYRRFVTSLVALAATATVLVACSKADNAARETLDEFLAGWVAGDLAEVSFLSPLSEPIPSAEAGAQLTALSGDLAGEPPELTVAELTVNDGLATSEVDVVWPLPGGASWSYRTRIRLQEGDDGWQVIWAPEVVHPELVAGDALLLRRATAPRGDILDGTGNPIVTARPLHVVGIWPSQVTDETALRSGLAAAFDSIGLDLGETLDALPDRIDAARDDDLLVHVVDLREEDYRQVEAQLASLDGVLVRDEQRHLAPSRTFARALLGTVGPVTAEIREANPGVYGPNDQVGLFGLSQEYEEQLRGVPGQRVVLERDELELTRIEPVPGTDLHTTLDQGVQAAAESALSAEDRRAALVAIRVSDGAVVAVANTEGSNANDVNLALTGSVPPGSTMKVVSAYGLLAAGEVTLDTPVACPAEFTVGGHTIGNAFSGDQGEIPFREAVAISCNTAFAGLAPRLGDDGLAAAGTAMGLGGDWDLGTPTFTGSVTTGGSESHQAQAAFGQGDTVVSPAAMAAATAAIARGAWLPPTLVVGPEAATAGPAPLEASATTDVQAAMRAVVTGGTASELASTPGGDVYGKTGSAEAGGDITHGWFVGWQGDLAIAVFVEDGRSGSGAAVPLADQFFRTLASA